SNGNILSSKKSMLIPKAGSGFIPNEMFEHHVQVAKDTLAKTLDDAGLDMNGMDCIAFSQGMGIPNSLRVGASVARYLSLKYNKPLIGINHAIGHIEIGRLTTGAKDPVIVYISGGNTQIIARAGNRYRVFGETLDIPIGNAFDVAARVLELKMPGGPEIEKIALGGKYIELPYTVKGMDLSFTGVVTDAERKYRNSASKNDIAYSLQETCFSMLTEVTERALAQTGKDSVLVVGGVAANKRLQEMMSKMCNERNAKLFVVDDRYAGDNGSMIAWTGLLERKSGKSTRLSDSGIRQNWRTEDVNLPAI
ncbi:tRNA (adenosine(37)-N6)-threonylcarbamoyltransferase complex transferase subunit TsaD, partial [archaeon]